MFRLVYSRIISLCIKYGGFPHKQNSMSTTYPEPCGSAGSQSHFSHSHSQDQELDVTIKFDSNKTCCITVKRTMKICEIKELASPELKRTPSLFNLIFAGQLLNDQKTVEDYNLVGQTTLHAFSVSGKPAHGSGSSLFLNPANQESYNRFFVYCKVCEYVNPGKLRVCCRLCGSSLFVVNQGPSDWEDISPGTSIQGSCKNEGCSNTTPSFYIKCCHFHQSQTDGDDLMTVSLKHVQSNTKHVECIVCQEVVSPVLIFPCPPGHVICLECFKEYAVTSLNSRQFVEHEQHGYTLSCPSGSCRDYFIEDSHHFYIMGKQEYERFKNFGAEEFVLRNGGVLCPGRGCGMGMFPDNDDNRIKCTECQFVSCRLCHREFHYGSCEESLQSERSDFQRPMFDGERAQRASWENQSLSLIETISKPCPNCKVKTQHSGGCMHMSCSRCHTGWCWLCVKPWERTCEESHWFG